MTKILTYLFGSLMVSAGVNHFISPQIYNPFIPDFLPELAINYVVGLLEIVLGVGAFIPVSRKTATLGILILMSIFLPFHALDVFRENPAIGSHTAALIRLPIQFVLIVWAWYIWKSASKKPDVN